MHISNHLDDLQANILKGHGRNHTWCLFIRFYRNTATDEVRRWISDFSSELTTAREQIEDAALRRGDASYDGGTVVCFFLSAEGYRAIGQEGKLSPLDPSFVSGMKWKLNGRTGKDVLGDPHFREWEQNYAFTIDAMVLLADDSRARLSERRARLQREMAASGVGKVLFTEMGSPIRREGQVVEHFGFADSIDPLQLLGRNDEPLDEICRINVFDDDLGSYLVFRKYEQNVWLFNQKTRALAEQLGVGEEFAGAQLVGRFRNGISLRQAPSPDGPVDPSAKNALDYEGARCPFHAHARKANPGADIPGSQGYRIVRRGVTYGHRADDFSDEPNEGVGLLFMSYQRSISRQFEAILIDWINNPRLPGEYGRMAKTEVGVDPLLGASDGQARQRWSRRWDSRNENARLDFETAVAPAGKPVNFRGGEYFYAPAISSLRDIGLVSAPRGEQQAKSPLPQPYPISSGPTWSRARRLGYRNRSI